MIEIIVGIFLILGSLFTLVAAFGIIRLPDVYMRMHAITKASSLATIFFILAVTVAYPGWRVMFGGLLLVAFVIATAPVSTHVLAGVSMLLGIKMAPDSKQNDLDYAPDKDKTDDSTSTEQ